MKVFLSFTFVALLMGSQAFAGGKVEVCKYVTSDIGTIVGKGKTSADAFEDAATQCFDRRARLFKAQRKIDSIGEDPGIMYIDICANLTCST